MDSASLFHFPHIENGFHHILYSFCCFFLNAVWALTSGGFRIVSDTLVSEYVKLQK